MNEARHAPLTGLVGALGHQEPSPHHGEGQVGLLRAYEPADGRSVHLIHLVVVPPGASLGRHRHDDDTEWYVIVDGEATMHLDGEAVRVRAGDVVRNRPFGEHDLVNDSCRDVGVVVFKIGGLAPDLQLSDRRASPSKDQAAGRGRPGRSAR